MKHVSYSKIVFVCVCVFVCVLSSCRPDTTCRENTKVAMVCEFRRVYFDEGRQMQVDLTWDSITVVGLDKAEPLYDNSKYIIQLSLPLHVAEDSTLYTLRYHNMVDTLCVYHSNTPEFVSMECGCAVTHTILQLTNTRHWIDSVAIVDGSMHRESKTNLELWKYDF